MVEAPVISMDEDASALPLPAPLAASASAPHNDAALSVFGDADVDVDNLVVPRPYVANTRSLKLAEGLPLRKTAAHQTATAIHPAAKGSFGKVYCVTVDGKLAAAKRQTLDERSVREYVTSRSLTDCKYLLDVLDAYVDEDTGELCTLSDWLRGDTFEAYGKDGLKEKYLRDVALDLLRGLDHMHQRGYCHLDVKPDNFIVTERATVLIDFGNTLNIAEAEAEASADGQDGTVPCPRTNGCFTSPFVREDGRIRTDDLMRADLFGIGLSLVYGIVGFKRFRGNAAPMPDEPSLGLLSEELRDFLSCLLEQPTTGHRSPASASGHIRSAGEALRHPWLTGERLADRCCVLGNDAVSLQDQCAGEVVEGEDEGYFVME